MTVRPFVRKPHFYETDQMGIVHHSNYIRWFEEARVDFLEQIGFGYDRCVAAGIDIILLGVACDYRSMTRFGETVKISLAIPVFSPTRMTISYRVEGSGSRVLRAEGTTRHCFYDGRVERPVSLRKALPELCSLFESYAGHPAEGTL